MSDRSTRPAAVAGSFYPASAARLDELVAGLFDAAARLPSSVVAPGSGDALPLGILVPHAGLVYSGVTASAGWACLPAEAGEHGEPPIVVILGTNHRAGWLDGVAAWERGAWALPAETIQVDAALAAEVLALGQPFVADLDAHLGEHSIEVHLPLLAVAAPGARIVPLAVSCGVGARAQQAGERLGRLLAEVRAAGEPVVLAISTDMAHYPSARTAQAVTERLLPAITGLDPVALAREEAAVTASGERGLACGMCGIQPAVLGLAALRAMGAAGGRALAASTSADAGGPADRTVGYLAVRFDA